MLKKKITNFLGSVIVTVSVTGALVACGNVNNKEVVTEKVNIDKEEHKETENVSSNSNEPNVDARAILTGITEDFNTTINDLTQKADTLYSEVGNSYDDYKKNKQLIDDYYTLTYKEFSTLLERTFGKSLEYFRAVVESIENNSRDELEKALNNYYGVIYEEGSDIFYGDIYDSISNELYEKALDDYYKIVYEDAMDMFDNDVYDDIYNDIKDKYYDGILYTNEHNEWDDERSLAYDEWDKARSNIYDLLDKAKSLIYEYRSEVNQELLWEDNRDIENIISNLDEPSFLQTAPSTNESEAVSQKVDS